MNAKRWVAALVLGGAVCLTSGGRVWGDDTELPLQDKPPSESPLAQEPQTPEELFDATLFMLKLGKLDLARYYIEKLVAADPDDLTLLRMRDKHDTAIFLEIMRVDEIAKPADWLAKRLQEATRNHVADAGYFPAILAKLSAGGREQAEAIDELRYLGSYAIPPMLSELQNPQRTDKGLLLFAMTRLGKDAVEPLVGALLSPAADVRASAAEVLGVVGGEEEQVWLQRMAFSPAEPESSQHAAKAALARLAYGDPAKTNRLSGYGASDRLTRLAIGYLDRTHKWSENLQEDGLRRVWSWDAAAGTVKEFKTSDHLAGIFFAERLARDAAELRPEAEPPVTVLLAALMARDVEQAGWDQSIPFGDGTAHDFAVTSGAQQCTTLLEFGLEHNLPSVQLVALEALALNGSPRLLAPQGPIAPVVVRALDAPAPRVQFAAATTILSWEPQQPFEGSRRVVEILSQTLQGADVPQSVVIDPNAIRASETAGLFGDIGYQGIQTRTGMDGFQAAVNKGNIHLAVVHPNTIRWELTDTIANFRKDARTKYLPIVIYGPAELESKLNWLTERYERVQFVSESPNPADLSSQLKPFLAQISPPALTESQRASQIADAVFWLGRMADAPDGLYDLSPAEAGLSSAANDPQLAIDAITALSAIPSATVQQRLYSLMIAPAVQPKIRQRAALTLATHLQRHGDQLLGTQREQLESAMTTETDPVVKTGIRSVIGVLHPTPNAVRKQLLDNPASTQPVVQGSATPNP